MSDKDINDFASSDAKKVGKAYQDYKNSDGLNLNPAKAVEGLMWAVALFSALGMVLVLPWVGEGKMIGGTQWIGLGTSFIVVGLVGAGIVRMANAGFKDADRSMSNRFERGR